MSSSDKPALLLDPLINAPCDVTGGCTKAPWCNMGLSFAACCPIITASPPLLSTLCIASPPSPSLPPPQCGVFLSWVWPWSMPSPSLESSSFLSSRHAIWSMHSPFSSRLQLARCSPLPSCSFCQRFDIHLRPCARTHITHACTHTENPSFFFPLSQPSPPPPFLACFLGL